MTSSWWPNSYDQIDPTWLSGALVDAGLLAPGVSVRDVEIAPITDLGGVNGEAFRLRLGYDPASKAGPRSLVAKFPARSPGALGVARYQRWYEREVRFYRELATKAPAGAPRCYAAEIDADDAYLLLLEDLAPARQGDQLAGCDVEEARAAVTAAAALHARWWDEPTLTDHRWLPLTTVGLERARAVQGAVRHGWEVAERHGLLPPWLAAAGSAAVEAYPALLERIARPPFTVVHGDYRLDNIFFTTDGEVRVIDWQFCCRARGAYDIGYFLGLNLEPEVRAAHDEALLASYVAALEALGVRGYDLDTCHEDYRVSLILGLAVFLIGAAGEQPNARMQRVHETGIARLVRAIEEARALDVL